MTQEAETINDDQMWELITKCDHTMSDKTADIVSQWAKDHTIHIKPSNPYFPKSGLAYTVEQYADDDTREQMADLYKRLK